MKECPLCDGEIHGYADIKKQSPFLSSLIRLLAHELAYNYFLGLYDGRGDKNAVVRAKARAEKGSDGWKEDVEKIIDKVC